ncbi:MAG: F0F1 ATP synthase subunit A [Roseiarcus sp.]|uniref:F0F1 ATP synthase subunit A n=1 Tax=Roseiarcus sp. TaxID=1969460 RepID=UPI003C164B6D
MAGEAGSAINPIEQFSITPIIPIRIAGHDFSLTNSSLYMVIAVAIVCLVMTAGARGGPGVPGRLQSAAELAYEFIAGMLRSATGEKGMRFFPMVFTIFMFVLVINLIGLPAYTFEVTAQIVITAALALLVFLTVIVVGLKEHGLHWFKLFVPSGVPIYILPLVVAIEIISFLTRPLSHSVRLFANMLAGHIMLSVLGSFSVMLLGAGIVFKVLAVVPIVMNVGVFALELLVAFLQAYVFAMLTCMYLNDAIHPGGH